MSPPRGWPPRGAACRARTGSQPVSPPCPTEAARGVLAAAHGPAQFSCRAGCSGQLGARQGSFLSAFTFLSFFWLSYRNHSEAHPFTETPLCFPESLSPGLAWCSCPSSVGSLSAPGPAGKLSPQTAKCVPRCEAAMQEAPGIRQRPPKQ